MPSKGIWTTRRSWEILSWIQPPLQVQIACWMSKIKSLKQQGKENVQHKEAIPVYRTIIIALRLTSSENAAMFCHRIYAVSRQSGHKSPQHFQPVHQIYSREIVSATASRSTTSTITRNEMLDGMFSSCNVHSPSVQINMNIAPSRKEWSGSYFSKFSSYFTWELFYINSRSCWRSFCCKQILRQNGHRFLFIQVLSQ